MSTLIELSDYLQGHGFGTIGSLGQWGIFRTRIPAAAHDDAIGLYLTGGFKSSKTFSGQPGTSVFTQPTFQIVVRSKNADAAEAKAYAIWKALDGLGGVLMYGTWWHFIEANHEPFDMGPDENDRIRIACNYQAIKKVSAA